MELKICGLKTLWDIECVNRAEVNYAGFVFAQSRQQIDKETARNLKAALNPKIKAVGVFINEPQEFIKELVLGGIIDLVQFHGNSEYIMPCQTIKAFRMKEAGDIKQTTCDFVLFDAFKDGERGSTGKTFDWKLIEGYNSKPFFLAGGINITNIKKAVQLNPYCIDLSTGAEENGRKSFEKIMAIKEVVKNV